MSGEIQLGGGRTFRWMIQGEKVPEIYGWVEDEDRHIVNGTGGWYRTTDPNIAVEYARAAVGSATP